LHCLDDAGYINADAIGFKGHFVWALKPVLDNKYQGKCSVNLEVLFSGRSRKSKIPII
jgi:hypothetical protein